LRRGIKVFTVATGIAKLEFYNHLRKAAEVAEDGITPSSRRLRPSAARSMPSFSSNSAPSN
jgi:phage terminase large subunit GpA-like protein